ncbi:MAG: DUF4838 domain-containing protein [Clostridia bacterium]|nr:DUF4838 domain-containing protein [Clostridia bacterium]
MKKLLCAMLCGCMLLSSFVLAYASDGDLTVDAGWSVLIPAEPTAYESYAAERLSSGLSEVFGVQIPVVTSASGRYIALGAAAAADVSGVAVNGYRIAVLDGNIHIAGTGVRGLIAGVNRFLETFCGRKVYTSRLTVLPRADAVTVPADTDIRYEPFFEYTDTDWRSPHDAEYSLANGLTGGVYRRLPAEAGATVDYLGGFCHTMGGLCETAHYADAHPEYLALHDGKRTAAQPCLTNPDVLAIATRNVLAILAEKHDPNASLQIVSVTQNDNQDYCECERCRAFEKAHGGVQSATMVNFVNQIADAVKEAGYDNVAIDTFAYQYTRKAPKNIVPRDNVIIRLCTIECCFAHALDDPSCEENVSLMQDLNDWSAICERIYVWDYTTNYLNTCMVFPDFGVIRRNIRVFYEHNVKGVYEEGNYYIEGCDTEFGELRAYMIAKSLQDPYCDIENEMNGFLSAYYGAGWQSVRSALDLYVSRAGTAGKGHLHIYESPKGSMQLSNREVRLIDGYWAEAKNAAENETVLEHVERSELSWRFWKASVNKGEFSLLNPDRYDEKQKLFEDLQAFGVNSLNEGGSGDYLDCICVRYAPANEWNMYEADEFGARMRLLFGKILERLTPLLSAFGVYYRLSQKTN